MEFRSFRSVLVALFALLSLTNFALADQDVQYISYTENDGTNVYLRDNRKPALYTGNFGDCLGSSLINVTRFDAAYYKDNMTVLFHLAGNSGLTNQSLMMYIGVFAYGESRFDLTFNPCAANIASLCPLNESIPIEASGIIPVNKQDVAGVPPIALVIPDFEGQAILRIFSNTTESEIACFSAVVTNGATFSHPAAVGSTLGFFTVVALIASFTPAIYGDNVPAMRTHYAHSMSILVVFAVWQHIFYTGALSMNWPSVLVAFWSNFAWAGGMIYSKSMQTSINSFIGNNRGNTSAVGAASSGSKQEGLGGGYDIHSIYGRSLPSVKQLLRRSHFGLDSNPAPRAEHLLRKRALAGKAEGFGWYGHPVQAGLPLPGNYSGFAGTLAPEEIPASNAFLTGFLWFLILVVLVAAAVIASKWTVELLAKIKWIKQDRLTYFRSHWVNYTALAVLRTFFIAFFMMMLLTLFQFTYHGAPGMLAVAAIVFLTFFLGMFTICIYACYYRIKFGNYVSQPDRLNVERRKVLKFIPWYGFTRASTHQYEEETVYAGSIPFWRVSPANPETTKSVHEDEDYTKKFGWLASRFRHTRWWFFVVWLVYELVRACFYGGASGNPMAQVFGLLVIEFIAFLGIIMFRPFEGQRLNAIVVYCLGFSKVASVALSAAFDVRFDLARIPTTVIGIVIVVIQGILTIITLIGIIIGAITSYMSIMRHRETENFRPKKWRRWRERYYKHLDWAQTDLPRPPRVKEEKPAIEPEVPKGPYFSVNSIKRIPKVEDEDPEFIVDAMPNQAASHGSVSNAGKIEAFPPAPAAMPSTRPTRTASVSSQISHSNLPRGARVHRQSWSTREFEHWQESERQKSSGSMVPFFSGEGSHSRRTSALMRDPRFHTSRESLSHTPVGSRPVSSSDWVSSPPPAITRGRGGGNWRGSSGEHVASQNRPQLKTLFSEDAIEMVRSPTGFSPSPARGPSGRSPMGRGSGAVSPVAVSPIEEKTSGEQVNR